ncbi:hypothetical protein [Absidia glauca]|uniref:C2H2-type domain-containing protein n=1 Tax=Absidia glauca TaxID=4829 RepID=A0A168LP21_ABSGL|nr:hypothetical protein [Absidia glauca]
MMSPQISHPSFYPSLDWPLNKIEEDSLTETTAHSTTETTIPQQQQRHHSNMTFRRLSSGFRCESCQRRFHSIGNLSNHQQLYQH